MFIDKKENIEKAKLWFGQVKPNTFLEEFTDTEILILYEEYFFKNIEEGKDAIIWFHETKPQSSISNFCAHEILSLYRYNLKKQECDSLNEERND